MVGKHSINFTYWTFRPPCGLTNLAKTKLYADTTSKLNSQTNQNYISKGSIPPIFGSVPAKISIGSQRPTVSNPGNVERGCTNKSFHLFREFRPIHSIQLLKYVFLFADTGAITKPALGAFYRSVIGLNAARVDEIIDTAYDRMTSVRYLHSSLLQPSHKQA